MITHTPTQAKTGYNMIHLTPIQQLGVSKSSYSLHSHHQLADSLGLNGKGIDNVDFWNCSKCRVIEQDSRLKLEIQFAWLPFVHSYCFI